MNGVRVVFSISLGSLDEIVELLCAKDARDRMKLPPITSLFKE